MLAQVNVGGFISCSIKDKRTGKVTAQFDVKNAISTHLLSGIFKLIQSGVHPGEGGTQVGSCAPAKVRIYTNAASTTFDEFWHNGVSAPASSVETNTVTPSTETISVSFTDQEVADTGSGEGSRTIHKIGILTADNQELGSMIPSDSFYPTEFKSGNAGISYGNFSLFTMTYSLKITWPGTWNATYRENILKAISEPTKGVWSRTGTGYNNKLVRCNVFPTESAAALDTDGTSNAGFASSALSRTIAIGGGATSSNTDMAFTNVNAASLNFDTSSGVHAAVYYQNAGADSGGVTYAQAAREHVTPSPTDHFTTGTQNDWSQWNVGDTLTVRFKLSVTAS